MNDFGSGCAEKNLEEMQLASSFCTQDELESDLGGLFSARTKTTGKGVHKVIISIEN